MPPCNVAALPGCAASGVFVLFSLPPTPLHLLYRPQPMPLQLAVALLQLMQHISPPPHAPTRCSHFVTRDIQSHGKYVNLLGLRGELMRCLPLAAS